MKEKYPEPAQWRCVCFSNEVHWSVGPEGKVRIIRKPREHCANCIQHTFNRSNKKQWNKRQHSWAAVDYNFKSDITFHTANNKNRKMSSSVYCDQILEPIVKP
jgi:hypothetical protein